MSTLTDHTIAFGISSYAYAWSVGVPGYPPPAPMTATKLLATVERLGAQNLQLADNLPVHIMTDGGWRDLIDRAGRAGIQLELGLRGLTVDHLQRYLRLSQDCNATFLRVVIDAPGYAPGHDEIVRTIRRVLPHFIEAGVVLAIENHDRFRASELLDIIEATDPAWVGICLDTANSLGAGEDIYRVGELLIPSTVNLHVKDYCIARLNHNMGFTVTGTPAGEGQAPLAWLLRELSRTGRCRSATLETWSLPLETVAATTAREREWSAAGAAYLRSALTKVSSQASTTH